MKTMLWIALSTCVHHDFPPSLSLSLSLPPWNYQSQPHKSVQKGQSLWVWPHLKKHAAFYFDSCFLVYPSFPAFVSADTVCCFFPAALLHMEKPQIDSEKPDVFECRPELEKERKKKKVYCYYSNCFSSAALSYFFLSLALLAQKSSVIWY